MRLSTPFHTVYRPLEQGRRAVARRSILARALRADVVTPALGVVLVWGEPLVGKSTLLRQVLWSLEPDAFAVARLPIGALAEPLPGTCRAADLLSSQVSMQLAGSGEATAAAGEARGLAESLDRCLAGAEQSERLLVVAVEGVDRYIGGVWPEGVLRNLALLLSRAPGMALVLTSRLPLARLEAVEVPDHVRIHFVPPLDRDDARRLLTGPVRGWLEYGTEALDHLLDAAGGRPLLLQIIGRNCTRVARAVDRPFIGLEVASEILASCWLAGETLFRPLLGTLSPTAQHLLQATAVASREAPAAFEAVYATAQQLGTDLSLAAFGNEMSMLRMARHLDSDEAERHWLTCGWLGRYLRAA